MLTLLQIVQRVCKRTGLPVPSQVIGSTEPQVLQMAGLMDELLEDLEQRPSFDGATRTTEFTSVAINLQGPIVDICDVGFIRILPDTFWNNTLQQKVLFGLTPEEWKRELVTGSAAAVSPRAWLQDGELYVAPIGVYAYSFVFQSKAVILAANNSTVKNAWTADDDQFMLLDTLALSWLRYAWKREKGLDYGEEKILYERAVETLGKRNNGPRPVDMGGQRTAIYGARPLEGSWDL